MKTNKIIFLTVLVSLFVLCTTAQARIVKKKTLKPDRAQDTHQVQEDVEIDFTARELKLTPELVGISINGIKNKTEEHEQGELCLPDDNLNMAGACTMKAESMTGASCTCVAINVSSTYDAFGNCKTTYQCDCTCTK